MSDWGVHLFETKLGRCGLAWSPRGITGAALPERDEAGLLHHLHRWSPGAAVTDNLPPNVAEARADIIALLAGEPRPLDQAVLDMAGIGEFDQLTGHDILQAVDAGNAVTHGENGAHFSDIGFAVEVGDLALQDLGNFGGTNVHGSGGPLHGVLQTLQFGFDGIVVKA